MTTSRRARFGAACLVLSVLALVVGPAALAQSDDEGADQKLTIRKVDSTDPKAVQVSLIYNGSRQDLAGLTVREDGRQVKTQPVEPLAKAGIDTAVVFAVDGSRSMGRNGGITQAQDSIRKVITDMAPGDAIGLVSFGTEVTVLQDLTSDKAEALTAVEDLSAPVSGKTALWDGIKKGAALFDDEPDLQPNIVVITDGFDDSSESSESVARSSVAQSQAAVFVVAFNQQNQVDTEAMSKLVDLAGGRLFTAPKTEDLAASLATVKSSLANQFVFEYASAAERGSTELEVVVAGSRDVKSFVPGSVAQGSSALSPPADGGSPLPDVFSSGVGIALALGAIFAAVALGFYAVALLATKDESVLENVLMPYTEGFTPEDADEETGFAQTAFLQRAVEMTEGFAERRGFLEKVEEKLEQANLPLRAAEALFFYIAAAVILSLFILVVKGPFVGLLATLVIVMLPPAVLNFLAKRRQKQFNAQLPDMLQLLAGSLRAGYSLMQGVEAVAQEVAEPMGRELQRVCTEARLGRELEEALDGVGERMKSADFEWAVMAIRIQREVGGNLSELLMTVSETMISRERMRREVAALTAEGKISAIVLGILPPALGAVMFVVNPDYMRVLFTDSFGKGLLIVGVVMALVGFAWMKKLIKIEI